MHCENSYLAVRDASAKGKSLENDIKLRKPSVSIPRPPGKDDGPVRAEGAEEPAGIVF